jgi:SAM-dependent methyltransferase
MEEWHEQDSFWQTMAPKLFAGRHWEQAPQQVERMIALLRLEPGAAVLDLCCGPGRHALELAHRGFRVTGVDRTASYLEQARIQAEREGLSLELVQEDMRAFCRPEAFDAAINVYTSFGYFKDPSDDRRVLVNLHRSLKQEGILLIDTMGKEVLARIFRERDWHEQDGVIYLEEREVQPGWGWIENRWIMLKDGERKDFTLGHRLYSAAELAALLADVGFASVDVYGDLEGAPYDHQAKRLIAVARKG